MKTLRLSKAVTSMCMTLMLLVSAISVAFAAKPEAEDETAGNNLSFPVIWAEGIKIAIPEMPYLDASNPTLKGEWWYWWGTEGTDPDIVPLSCPPDPDPDYEWLCASGNPPGEGWVKAYLQKDPQNWWQAGSVNAVDEGFAVEVDKIDWGDNLESVDWYIRSQVRVEVVLFKDLDPQDDLDELSPFSPMLEYEMRHVSGWGIDEVHGLAVNDVGPMPGPGTQATVYTHCARLTIQKLLVSRENVGEKDLVWGCNLPSARPARTHYFQS